MAGKRAAAKRKAATSSSSEPKIEYLPVEALKSYPQSPRMHSPDQVANIAASMDDFGWAVPLLVDAEGMIIGGPGRLDAAELRGIEMVPVIRLDYLTPEQVRAYRAAGNLLTGLGEWDAPLLAGELEALRDVDLDLSLIGIEGPGLTG